LRSHFTPKDIVKARAIEERLYAQTWLAPDYDVLARLRKLNVSTLVIHGDQDFVPLDCARSVAQAVSGSRLVVLSDCGHFAHVERPDEVLNAIVAFVTQC
jgi:pimeloyl-ACP methyl ester carboxylesterase